MKRFSILFISLALFSLFIACGNSNQEQTNEQLSGTLHIIHAGSMSLPVKQIADTFMKIHPNVEILTEAWGSKAGARRIVDLNQDCDVYISADYRIIDDMLIPDYANWNIKFAGNEMAIVYTENSRYADIINADNWCEILLKDDVIFARSDPNVDPCGARSVIVAELAQWYYKIPDFKKQIISRHRNYIRPKETDLIAFLEQAAVDYLFLYRSVAEQHALKYIKLPDEINLRVPSFDSLYHKASVEVSGKAPGKTVIEYGESMVYGITIPKGVKNSPLAEEFVKFFLEKNNGQQIIEYNGQTSLVPSDTDSYKNVPDSLKQFCSKSEK